MNRARRFGRLLGIVSEVVRNPGQTPAQLAAGLGISERTLFRDLLALRRLGVDVSFSEGYQLQERLALGESGGAAPAPALSLPVVYEQQLRLLRTSFSPALADRVQAEVERGAPVALAELFCRALEQLGRGSGAAPAPGPKMGVGRGDSGFPRGVQGESP